MTEFLAPVPEEVALGQRVLLVKGQIMRLGSEPLIHAQRAAEHFHTSGDILAILEMPNEHDGELSKRVGIVDYGRDFNDKPIITDMRGLGNPRTRYGLMGLNYVPDSHMLAYTALKPGQPVVLGRVDDMSLPERHNYALGLVDGEPGNSGISRLHAEVRLDADGTIQITDLSSNGTIIELPSYPELA